MGPGIVEAAETDQQYCGLQAAVGGQVAGHPQGRIISLRTRIPGEAFLSSCPGVGQGQRVQGQQRGDAPFDPDVNSFLSVERLKEQATKVLEASKGWPGKGNDLIFGIIRNYILMLA